MMCPSDQLLSAYADRELAAAELAMIGEHIADCAACRETYFQYAMIGETLRSAVLDEPSPAAQARWLNSLRPAADRGVRTLAGVLTAAAAIVIAVTVAIPSQAQATSAPADWEKVALAGSTDVNQTPQGTAQWIVADLSVGSTDAGTDAGIGNGGGR